MFLSRPCLWRKLLENMSHQRHSETEQNHEKATVQCVCFIPTDCGSTVRRRGGTEGREEMAGTGDTDSAEVNKRYHEEDVGETRRSPSPPPSIDSGQSGQSVNC